MLSRSPDSIIREAILSRSIRRESKEKRRQRLLVEFLSERSARRQVNAEQETPSQVTQTEVQNQVTDSHDLLFKIFMLLPAESLFRLQFVCKMWLNLIKTSTFTRCHTQQTEIGLMSRRLLRLEHDEKQISYFHFLDLDRRGNDFMESSEADLTIIRASYDGLILATSGKPQNLILMNPVTRKHISLPLGEINVKSYGIASCNQTYKVVLLFREGPGPFGCMIMHDICAGSWARIEGPSSDLSVDVEKLPVSVRGVLNWMPSRRGCEFFVSMKVDDEKFVSRHLPVRCNSRSRLLDIGGDLGFATYAPGDMLQVWILYGCGLQLQENWVKKCSIYTSVYYPFCPRMICSKNGKGVVLETNNELYDCSFETGEMKAIRSGSDNEVRIGRTDRMYIPHRNTLASWEQHN